MKAKIFSLTRYLEECLRKAEYFRDENGVVIARVPDAPGFFAQGDSFEEARENLRDAIEGNVILALQLGFEIPHLRRDTVLTHKDLDVYFYTFKYCGRSCKK